MSNTTGHTILTDTEGFLRRFVAFENPDHALALSLWILHTHAFDAAYTTPYLYVTSAEKQSGKTRTIEAASSLARNPKTAADMTSASMFRLIEATRPALFVDEVDTLYSGGKNEEVRVVLNSGYRYNGTITRTVPGKNDDPMGNVREFSTFCPKLLAGIDNGQLPDTIADRCIRITLKRAKADAQIERFILRKVEDDAKELRNRIHHWAMTNLEKLAEAEPKPIEDISDRAWDICEPLIAIAELCGVGKAARAALSRLMQGEAPALSPAAQVLSVARDLFNETGADRITNSMLAEASGYPAAKAARMIAPYGIKSITVRYGGAVTRGYFRADFEDAWSRYLPAEDSK